MRVSIIPRIVKKLRQLIGIVQDTDTATRNIEEGKYVVWKGSLCKATTAITTGDTLSSSNLEAVVDGGLNAVDSSLFPYLGIGLSNTPKIVAYANGNPVYGIFNDNINLSSMGKDSDVYTGITLPNNAVVLYLYCILHHTSAVSAGYYEKAHISVNASKKVNVRQTVTSEAPNATARVVVLYTLGT